MSGKMFLVITVLCFLGAVFALGLAQEQKAVPAAAKHQFIGAKKCIMCHKKDGVGPTWETTPHAGAWGNIDSVKVAADKQAPCKTCHATGVTEKGEFLAGVQCEACHGAGSDYNTMKIMKDKQMAIANGLLIPNEKTCLACHDKTKAPKEYHAKMPDKFEYEKMKVKGIHALPGKAAQ